MSSNFPKIVNVNGFACRNGGDVAYAKRFIDPARPAAGAFGLNLPQPAGIAPRPKDLGEIVRNRSAGPPSGAAPAPKPVGASVDKLA